LLQPQIGKLIEDELVMEWEDIGWDEKFGRKMKKVVGERCRTNKQMDEEDENSSF